MSHGTESTAIVYVQGLALTILMVVVALGHTN